MAENPATWGEAEKVIHEALQGAEEGRRQGLVGWSTPRQIAEALRRADLLASAQLTARAQAADAYAQQNRDLHRENTRLRDECAELENRLREEGHVA